jgi:C-terminal processing protease CtpA/Prc
MGKIAAAYNGRLDFSILSMELCLILEVQKSERIKSFAARRSKMKLMIKFGTLAGVLFLLTFMVLGSATAKKYDSDDAWIGIYTQSIDEDLQEAFDLDRDEGVVVIDVVDDSPADEAGLRRKDIIIEVNGNEIDDSKEIVELVEELEVGDDIEVVIVRKGKEKTFEIELEERPEYEWFGKSPGSSYKMPNIISRNYRFSSGSEGYIGVAIQSLNEQLGEYFEVDDGEGVLVTEVFEDSPADAAGLKAGDVIIAVDGESVAETGELQEIITDKEEGDEVTVAYIRKGEKGKVVVEVTEESFGLKNFTLPDFNFSMPDLSGLKNLDHFYFGDDDHEYFDAEEYKEQMKQLKKELKELGKELRELKSKLK